MRRNPYSGSAGLVGPYAPAREKLIKRTDQFGQLPINNSQGAPTHIYDSLPLDGSTATFRFFEGCSARTFPRTNMATNKFEDQEGLIVAYMGISVVTFDAVATNQVNDIQTPEDAGQPGIYGGEFHIEVANNRITKNNGLILFKPGFNPGAPNQLLGLLRMPNQAAITPQTEFIVPVRLTQLLTVANAELRVDLYGPGALRRLNAPV